MTPATYNFSVMRGTAGQGQGLTLRLKTQVGDDLVNVPFEDVRLSIYKRNELVLREAVSDNSGRLIVSNAGEAEIMWVPRAEDTRKIPKGVEKVDYEVEVWNGPNTEVVYLMGKITGIGGINDDQDEEVS